jgi:sporulation protein YlmC with PRC-barrel domain
VEEADHRPQNPYTALEGYEVLDASGKSAGKVESTVYDAPSDVLKYVIVNGHAIPAERIEVDADEERILTPYSGETISSAPEFEDPPSGAFDERLREHYGES